MKCIVNGRILMPDGIIDRRVLCFDERIVDIATEPPLVAQVIDARGNYVLPGLIDVHCHGFNGWDASHASLEEIRKMCAWNVQSGVTGWLPTTATLEWGALTRSFQAIRQAMRACAKADWAGSQVLGCHAEGPFINEKRRGAMLGQYILKPDINRIRPWADVIRLITVAPEVEGAIAFIRAARRMGIVVSMGHSDATAEQGVAGIDAGATHLTHTFNAMRDLNHRDPGLIGAAMNDDRVYCELIADTVHVSPLLFPIMARLKSHHLVLVTDSIQLAGLPEGAYDVMGGRYVVDANRCRTPEGTIAGSVLTMDRAVRNFARYSGIPLWRVVNMASLYPARSIRVDDRKGTLQRGKDADIVIADRDFNIRATYVRGECAYKKK